MHANARRLSRALCWIFLAGAVLAPLAACLISLNLEWVLGHAGQEFSLGFDLGVGPDAAGPITWDVRLLALAAMAAPTALTAFALWNLSRLFGSYARDEVFTDGNTRRIRRVGVCLLVRELLSPFEGAALSVILTLHNPPGQHQLTVSLRDSNVTMIVTALTIIVAAHVMAQARDMQAEAELTI